MNRILNTLVIFFIAALLGACASSGDIPRDVQFTNEAALLTRSVTGVDLIAPEACAGGAVANHDVRASADGTATRSTRHGEQSLIVVRGSKSQQCADGPATTRPERKVVRSVDQSASAAAKPATKK